jgi:hypothetical protein
MYFFLYFFHQFLFSPFWFIFRARLCTKDFDENIRATAAETLAYLAEVSIN